MPTRLPGILLLLAAALLTLSACDEDASNPADDGVIEFPSEVATLQEAIDLAGPGGTVRIDPGTHEVDDTIRFREGSRGVTVTGASERPILSCRLMSGTDLQIAMLIFRDASGVTISGLEFRGTYGIGVATEARGTRVENCVFVSPVFAGLDCYENPGTVAEATFLGNVVVGSEGNGISVREGALAIVSENTIVDSQNSGISIGPNSAEALVRRNIIVGSRAFGVQCDALFGSPFAALDCNVLHSNTVGDYSPDCTPGATDVLADPRFCETDTYTLRPDSPCAAENSGGCGFIGAVSEVCEGK